MVHIIKVYFTDPKGNVQIRRLTVNSDVVSRFELLVGKIREMFPGLAQGNIQVTWKDFELDVIHMSSDEELAHALASSEDDILRIYACSIDNQQCDDNGNQNFRSSSPAEVHQNVICDGCDKTIQGYRYKCLQCRNFDLCSACNATHKHENHDMIKLVRPSHISREWVFPGARKIWRSMFGRCPRSYFADTNENEGAATSDSKKGQWPGMLDDLLKGGCVSADKLIKENLGSFLNFIDSVSGNLDVKLESDLHCKNDKDKKTEQKTSNGSPPFAAAQCHPAEPVLKECPVPMMPKTTLTATSPVQLGSSASSVVLEQREKSAEPHGLFGSHDTKAFENSEAKDEVFKKLIDMAAMEENNTPPAEGSTEQKQNFAKPCGLFGDNESCEGWTILNKQEEEKNDAKSTNDNGTKPKYPSIYPSIFEKTDEVSQASGETKPKERQEDTFQVSPKPAVKAENDDNCAKLSQKEDVTVNHDPEIQNALIKMQAMGFTNEGGWLERLLITKDGNINSTLDALYPNTRRR